MITRDDGRTLLESLGLRPVINAMGAPSRLGGTILSAEVRTAMDAAAQHCIPLAEMQARASALIAEITGAEAGCVAPGAAASLFLGTAACMAGSDLAAIDRLPDTSGMRNEVVIHRAHRNPYDHAVRATGARLVEIGYLGVVSGVGTHQWQLRAALTPQTAAVYYFPPVAELVLDLATVKFMDSYLTKPNYLFGGGGALMGLLGLALAATTLYKKFCLGIFVKDQPLFQVSIFFALVGVQLILMGLLAEILIRVYYDVRERPVYFVRETLGFE